MIKTCGNCQFILYDDDGDGSKPYCAIRDLYYVVTPGMVACDDWREDNGNLLHKGFWLYNADVNKKLQQEKQV